MLVLWDVILALLDLEPCLELSPPGGPISTLGLNLCQRGKWMLFDVSPLLGNRQKSHGFLLSLLGYQFHFVAGTPVAFIAMTVGLNFSAFYSWILPDFVASHPLPKTLVYSLKRLIGAGVCLRGHDSSLSSKALMGKLSWPAGSGLVTGHSGQWPGSAVWWKQVSSIGIDFYLVFQGNLYLHGIPKILFCISLFFLTRGGRFILICKLMEQRLIVNVQLCLLITGPTLWTLQSVWGWECCHITNDNESGLSGQHLPSLHGYSALC